MTLITNKIRTMTDNKRVTNKQILDKIDKLKVSDTELNALAIKIVSRMVKLKSMEDWFHHVASSQASWDVAYADLDMTEEEDALGEAARLMTLLNLFGLPTNIHFSIGFHGKPTSSRSSFSQSNLNTLIQVSLS